MKSGSALLNRVKGYSASWLRWSSYKQRWALRAQAEQWADSITARYQFYERRWPLLGYQFARSQNEGATVVNQNNTQYAPVLLNPRLLLRLLISQQHYTQQVPSVRQEVRRQTLTIQQEFVYQKAQVNVQQETVDIVTRILRLGERQEMTSSSKQSVMRPSTVVTDEVIPKVVPTNYQLSVPKEFRKVSGITENTSELSNNPNSFTKASGAKNRQSVNAETHATVDINRITDQVMQALDHRIIAQRERLGRI